MPGGARRSSGGQHSINEAIIQMKNFKKREREKDGVAGDTDRHCSGNHSKEICSANRESRASARAQLPQWGSGAKGAVFRSMHSTLDQEPLLGSGCIPARLHMIL